MNHRNLDLFVSDDDLAQLRLFLEKRKYNVGHITEEHLFILYRRWLWNFMDVQEDWWEELLETDLHEDEFLEDIQELLTKPSDEE